METFVAGTGRICEKFDFLPEKALDYLEICNILKIYKKAVELCVAQIHSQFSLSFFEKQMLFRVFINSLRGSCRFEEACRIIKLNLPKMRKSKLVSILHYYRVLGACLYEMDNAKAALKYYKQAHFLTYFCLFFPALPMTHEDWISYYKRLVKFSKALKYVDEELAEYDKQKDKLHNAHFYAAMANKGICLLNLSRVQEAKDIFENIILIRRKSFMYDDNDYWTSLCNYNLSQCLMKLGRPEHALNLYENTRENDNFRNESLVEPTSCYLRHKAECFLRLGKTSEAYECYK